MNINKGKLIKEQDERQPGWQLGLHEGKWYARMHPRQFNPLWLNERTLPSALCASILPLPFLLLCSRCACLQIAAGVQGKCMPGSGVTKAYRSTAGAGGANLRGAKGTNAGHHWAGGGQWAAAAAIGYRTGAPASAGAKNQWRCEQGLERGVRLRRTLGAGGAAARQG